jgi:hypothetical protein
LHTLWHWPPPHVTEAFDAAVHALKQLPQLVRLVMRSTQLPLQFVSVPVHATVHDQDELT